MLSTLHVGACDFWQSFLWVSSNQLISMSCMECAEAATLCHNVNSLSIISSYKTQPSSASLSVDEAGCYI